MQATNIVNIKHSAIHMQATNIVNIKHSAIHMQATNIVTCHSLVVKLTCREIDLS